MRTEHSKMELVSLWMRPREWELGKYDTGRCHIWGADIKFTNVLTLNFPINTCCLQIPNP